MTAHHLAILALIVLCVLTSLFVQETVDNFRFATTLRQRRQSCLALLVGGVLAILAALMISDLLAAL